jgi:hypothetical protein
VDLPADSQCVHLILPLQLKLKVTNFIEYFAPHDSGNTQHGVLKKFVIQTRGELDALWCMHCL